jgi:hypothetical protein
LLPPVVWVTVWGAAGVAPLIEVEEVLFRDPDLGGMAGSSLMATEEGFAPLLTHFLVWYLATIQSLMRAASLGFGAGWFFGSQVANQYSRAAWLPPAFMAATSSGVNFPILMFWILKLYPRKRPAQLLHTKVWCSRSQLKELFSPHSKHVLFESSPLSALRVFSLFAAN